jgi:hypothetical protein
VKQAALSACLRPTPGNGQQDTFLAVTDHEAWCRYGDQRANTDTIQDNGVVYFTGRLRLRGNIPTPRCLVAPRTGSRAGWQLILRLLAEQPDHKPFEHEPAAKVRPFLDLRTATLRATVTLRSGSSLAPFL